MACQAQNESLTDKCTIEYNVNQSVKKSIEEPDACSILKNIVKNKIDNDISIVTKFHTMDTDMRNFLDNQNVVVKRLTYDIVLKNDGAPELDNVILETKLCGGLTYERSSYTEGTATFYEPTVIQNDISHTTSQVKWSIGKLMPGEERTISLDTLYLSGNPPEFTKTEFKMHATIWGYEILKQNDLIQPVISGEES